MYARRWLCLPLMRQACPPTTSEGWRAAVVTTLVASAEPIAMLERSVAAMVALDTRTTPGSSTKATTRTYVALYQRLGARHISRHGVPHLPARR
jgi:hypothetical protein